MTDTPFCSLPPARTPHSDILPGVWSFSPRLGEPFVWWLNGLDGLQHNFHCPFVVHLGLIPCNCLSIRQGFRSLWYRRWLRWSKVRVNPGWWARHRDAPPWPQTRKIASDPNWFLETHIEGWDA